MPTVYTAKQLSDDFVQDQEKKHQDPDAFRGFRFPMPWFMDRTGGLQKGWISFVFGKAGIGKTSVLSTSAVQNGLDSVPFVYFALEESVFTVAQRIFANLGHISRVKFRDIKLDQTDFHNLYQAASQFSKFDAFFVDDAWNDDEITAVLNAPELAHVEMVYLDYLQLMTMLKARNQSDNAAQASKFLTRIAKGKLTGKEKAVFAAVQLNDDGEPLWSRDPSRDADLVVEIEAISDGFGGELPDKRKFRIRKFRHGEPDATTVAFMGPRSMIGQIAPVSMQPPMP